MKTPLLTGAAILGALPFTAWAMTTTTTTQRDVFGVCALVSAVICVWLLSVLLHQNEVKDTAKQETARERRQEFSDFRELHMSQHQQIQQSIETIHAWGQEFAKQESMMAERFYAMLEQGLLTLQNEQRAAGNMFTTMQDTLVKGFSEIHADAQATVGTLAAVETAVTNGDTIRHDDAAIIIQAIQQVNTGIVSVHQAQISQLDGQFAALQTGLLQWENRHFVAQEQALARQAQLAQQMVVPLKEMHQQNSDLLLQVKDLFTRDQQQHEQFTHSLTSLSENNNALQVAIEQQTVMLGEITEHKNPLRERIIKMQEDLLARMSG